MKLDWTQAVNRSLRRPFIVVIAAMSMVGFVVAGGANADPAEDALAKLHELSREAEKTTEAMHSAQIELDAKLADQKSAQEKLAADQLAVKTANVHLSEYQTTVDKLAAAMYMGGRTDGLSAIMMAKSPQQLIDKMAVDKVMALQIASQMDRYRAIKQQATEAEAASERSAAEARTAAEQAARVRADVQAKQSRLQVQIAIVRSQYEGLSPDQRAALADPGPLPPAAPPPPPPEAPAAPSPEILAAAPPGPVAHEGIQPAAQVGPPPPEAMLPSPPAPPGPSTGSPGSAAVVQAALSRIGSPYSWGGSGPGVFDCSGLVMWSFQQIGKSLPHSSQALARGGQPVAISDMQPGDVVNYYGDASHTAIYIGDGMMVHASTFGVPVKVESVTNAPIYNVRRY